MEVTFKQQIHFLSHVKQSAALRATKVTVDAIKTASKEAIQKTAELTVDLIQKSEEHRIVSRKLQIKQKIMNLIEKY